MTVKLAKIVDPKFTAAYRKLMATQLPMKTAFQLKKMAKKINDEQRNYEDLRKELLAQFGDKKEDGTLITDEHGMVNMSGDNGKEFVIKHRELLDVDVDVGYLKLNDLSSVKITPEDLMVLEGIIRD